MSKRKRYFLNRFMAIEISVIICFLLCCWLFGFTKQVVVFYSLCFSGFGIMVGLMNLGEYYESQDYKNCPKCGKYFKGDGNIVKCISCDFQDLASNQQQTT